ncbi:DUF2270 domain-containing protein [Acanthopleuribacter pedis]|uniref:DUF2270 domain-containing protein n=1 Tax=Acanthopleuribacter pedis TaxID=442870 RepID=A0A8J7QCS3_9BACT|nr:DUF2270 domain-containing protein [Acanthopleuribacter pedis]MBO1322122.1 DUF2270 domain-containing protein [Acanthopleuribacter pedis]
MSDADSSVPQSAPASTAARMRRDTPLEPRIEEQEAAQHPVWSADDDPSPKMSEPFSNGDFECGEKVIDYTKEAHARGAFEEYPLTRNEYISAMVHFYRGELTRANEWRLRLDTSTNWAIIATMGLLSFAFGVREHTHGSMILGMYLVLHFLTLEARRFRFFDVWRTRLRMIEENFYGPILRRDLSSREHNWGRLVAEDLIHPRFKITYLQAVRTRLLRNYMPLFVTLLFAWIVKLMWHPETNSDLWFDRLAFGPVPWQVAFFLVFFLYASLACVVWLVPPSHPQDSDYWMEDVRPMDKIPDF